MGDRPPVPASFDEVSPAWLGEVLGLPVTGVDVAPLGPGVGFLGDVARVSVTYEGSSVPPVGGEPGPGPASVIVKLPPADPGGRRVGAMLDVWAREQAFYDEVAPASPGAQVPGCHHAAAEPDRGRWVLVLDDCPSDPLDAGAGATRDQADAAVDALAIFHGRWWQAGPTFAWMPGFDAAGVGGLQAVWLDAIPVFLERYGHLIPDGTDTWLVTFADRLPAWSDRAATEPLTIVHADYRLDNLRYHDGRMVILDWQTALRGPGPMDLSSFVITSCDATERRAWEPDLIARYGDGLRAAGVELADEWLHRSYDENLLWWMGQYASNLARLEPDDPDAQAALDTMIERTYTAAADREVGRLLR